MRRRSLTLVVVVLIAALGALYLAVRSPEGASRGGEQAGSGLDVQQVEAGEVDVTIDPVELDDEGAAFEITFDTHSVELDADVMRATLVVAGSEWPVMNWNGDGPGGHHREGTLRFRAMGPPKGEAVLALAGLPGPVEVRWVVGG